MSAGTGAAKSLIALVLMAAGTLWLLIATGFVPTSLLDVLATWWPLFLVGGGLDLLLPRSRPMRIPYTALATVAVLALALLGVTLGGPTTQRYGATRGPDVRTADVTLTLGSSRATVTGAEPGRLFSVDVTGNPRADVTLDGTRLTPNTSNGDTPATPAGGPGPQPGTDLEPTDPVKVEERARADISVRPLRDTAASFLDRGTWTIGLPLDLPLDLAIEGGSATTTLDLADLLLTYLSIDASSGALQADLPGLGAIYRAGVNGGSGGIELRIAPGASLDLEATFRSGSGVLHVGEGTDMRLTLRAGSGAVTLDLPDTAPIQLDVRDDGSGRLTVPAYLKRRSGSGDTGVWTSDTLDRGGRVIDVRIEQAGSGSITIR